MEKDSLRHGISACVFVVLCVGWRLSIPVLRQLGNPVAGTGVSIRFIAVAALLLTALALSGCARLPGSSSGLTSGQALQAPLQQAFDEGYYQLTAGDSAFSFSIVSMM